MRYMREAGRWSTLLLNCESRQRWVRVGGRWSIGEFCEIIDCYYNPHPNTSDFLPFAYLLPSEWAKVVQIADYASHLNTGR